MNKFELLLVSLAIFLFLLFIIFYFVDLINFVAMIFGVVSNALVVVLAMLNKRGKR